MSPLRSISLVAFVLIASQTLSWSVAPPPDLVGKGGRLTAYVDALRQRPSTNLLAAGGAAVRLSLANAQIAGGCGGAEDLRNSIFFAESSAPDILTATGAPGGIQILTGTKAGSADLVLRDQARNELDRFTFEVRVVTEVKSGLDTSALLADLAVRDRFEAFAGDHFLISDGALHFDLSGVLRHAAHDGGELPNDLWFSGGLGKGGILVSTTTGFSKVFEWTAVAPTDLATVELTATPETATVGNAVHVVAEPRNAGGVRIVGPRCDWSVTSPSVQLFSANDPNAPFGPSRIEALLHVAGSYDVTCTIGELHRTITLSTSAK